MIPASAPRFELRPFAYEDVERLIEALGVPEPVAITLVRRGFADVASARAFLAADETHDPHLIGGIDDAVAAIRGAIERGERITVHGDYDVDGVTATTIMVAALRELGAECDWLIPDRLGDGYGLSERTVRSLAERGTGLIVTVDCGITSVAEVAVANELGIAIVVTDHHEPGEELPDCPIVHPRIGEYPCGELCGAGVAHKLIGALAGVQRAERDLDLVALATVADMVPLTGENRSLVRRGLALARRAPRPGLRALMQAASVAPERLNEIDVSFRLAPRINAAGRLYRADAGVELLLSDDIERAEIIAAELDRANHERRETERLVLAEAEAQVRALEPEFAEAPALVLWGEGWHPGVVGICASRLVERYGKPAILIALDAEGRGKGSGRSIAGFDLLAGLRACDDLLSRYGGHVAAAGLEIEAEQLEPMRARFVEHAREAMLGGTAVPSEPIDAVVGSGALGLELAEQLGRLGPFGRGNPELRLLVPAARVSDVRPMGEGDRHARFSLSSSVGRAAGVAFGVNGSLERKAEGGLLDLEVKLELNEWNGAVEPRVVLERATEVEPSGESFEPELAQCAPEEFWARFDAELARVPGADPGRKAIGRELLGRQRSEQAAASTLATAAELASSGEATLIVCADARRRIGVIESALDPARFGGEVAVIAGRRSLLGTERKLERVLAASSGAVFCDWMALAAIPGMAEPFEHLLLLDPAPSRENELDGIARGRSGGWAHYGFGPAEIEFAAKVYTADAPSRESLAAIYRELREAGGDPELAFLAGSERTRTPEFVARSVGVLLEIGVVREQGSGPGRTLGVVSSKQGGLDSSPRFSAHNRASQETERFLSGLRQSA